MKLEVSALINFSVPQNISDLEQSSYRQLFKIRQWLSQFPNEKYNQTEYRQNLYRAVLDMNSIHCRKVYRKWIFSHYSNSLANHRMVQQMERSVLVRWAHRFNQRHVNLKIVGILPQINQNKYQACLLMSGCRVIRHKLSFDFRQALQTECQAEADGSFYQFELNENHSFAQIMQQLFQQCIPGLPFDWGDIRKLPHFFLKLRPVITSTKGKNKIKKQLQKSSSVPASKSVSQISRSSSNNQSANLSVSHSFVSFSQTDQHLRAKLSSTTKMNEHLSSQLAFQKNATDHLKTRLHALSSSANNISRSSSTIVSWSARIQSLSTSVSTSTSQSIAKIKKSAQKIKDALNSALASQNDLKQRLAKATSANGQEKHSVTNQSRVDYFHHRKATPEAFFRSQEYIPFIIIICILIMLLLILILPVLRL